MQTKLSPFAFALLAVSLMPVSAPAAAATYHMQILEPSLKVGSNVPLTVRIIDVSGCPAPHFAGARTVA